MDASHCWLGMKDFSDYRRVKVKAGTDFGKLQAKKDFEITCAWWNTRFSDSYEKGDTVTAHVGIREIDWSYGHFQFSKADSDEDIIKNLGWNFQSIWGGFISLGGIIMSSVQRQLGDSKTILKSESHSFG